MFDQFIQASERLYKSHEAFAIAFVINRKIPSSGKPGDKAVIHQDGRIEGWIGGGCTRGIVLKEALLAMQTGEARIVQISPSKDFESQEGVVTYNMTCHSGGTVELYIEPVMPKPHLIIMGKSQVAMALAKIAKAAEFRVGVYANSIEESHFNTADEIYQHYDLTDQVKSNSAIVICTQGENDEDALEQALNSEAGYIAFLASRKKANNIYKTLRDRGINFDQLKKIKTPAGIDIGAKTPQEVALSILAEMIQFKYSPEQKAKDNDVSVMPALNNAAGIFINPVCQVPVDKATAKHVINYKEKDYYFCCDGCKVSFEKEPEKYAMV